MPTVKQTTETAIVKSILEYLAIRRITAWRNNTTGTRRKAKDGREFWAFHGRKGASDIFGVLPRMGQSPAGRFLAIEAKRPGEGPSDDQIRFLDDVNNAGGVGFIARSIKDVELFLSQLDEV